MGDYIFFDEKLRDRFVGFIAERGIAGDVRPDPMEGFVVAVPDDLADDIENAIEGEYEALMDEQRRLVESTDKDGARDLMGVTVVRSDGQPRVVRLPAHYARRLFEHFSAEEIHELVSAIADSVEHPVDGPLCRTR